MVAQHKSLIDARMGRGLSLRTLADKVGVDKGQLSRIENGKEGISPKLAKRLAEFFSPDLTRDQILFPEEYREPSGKKPARSAR